MSKQEVIRWFPPEELSKREVRVCERCKRNGRLYSFLRRHRHELFDEDFQAKLAEMYRDNPRGQPPVAPALLAMVTILQAADGVSDEGAVNEAVFDLRWQMVLDCMGAESAPFSQGVLVSFRKRLVKHGLHKQLVLKSVEVAKKTGGFGYKNLRVALDSAPLWGAGRVEDTFNLIGHALEVVVQCAAAVAHRTPEDLYKSAELRLVGQSSLKAALDIDWDDKQEQRRALRELLGEVERLQLWLKHNNINPMLRASSAAQNLLDDFKHPHENVVLTCVYAYTFCVLAAKTPGGKRYNRQSVTSYSKSSLVRRHVCGYLVILLINKCHVSSDFLVIGIPQCIT